MKDLSEWRDELWRRRRQARKKQGSPRGRVSSFGCILRRAVAVFCMRRWQPIKRNLVYGHSYSHLFISGSPLWWITAPGFCRAAAAARPTPRKKPRCSTIYARDERFWGESLSTNVSYSMYPRIVSSSAALRLCHIPAPINFPFASKLLSDAIELSVMSRDNVLSLG